MISSEFSLITEGMGPNEVGYRNVASPWQSLGESQDYI